MSEPTFPAPTEDIELEIVELCLQVGLPFGEFWYNWFDSSDKPKENHTLHINCKVPWVGQTLKKEILNLKTFKIIKIHKYDLVILPEDQEFQFQYYFHFKTEPI